MGVSNQVEDTTKTFIAILGLGLVGLLFLIIFGNLSGNLGFADDTHTGVIVTNETNSFINSTGYTLSVVNSSTSNYVLTGIFSNTAGQVEEYNFTIGLSNATTSSVGVVTNITSFNTTLLGNVSISYTYAFATISQGEVESNEVIGNLTGGAVTFFGFSNVWFVLLAITLLIIIVISVIAVVSKGGKSNFTS